VETDAALAPLQSAACTYRIALGPRAGQKVLTLKTPYRGGTTHLIMSPLEFMQCLATLVSRPRLNLIRFHGVLAPNANLRAEIIQ
jgi:Putative transposase